MNEGSSDMEPASDPSPLVARNYYWWPEVGKVGYYLTNGG